MEYVKLDTTANEANNSHSSEIIKIKDIEGTPFKIVTMNDETFVALGNERITEFGNEEELLKRINGMQIDWEILFSVISIINLKLKNYKHDN